MRWIKGTVLTIVVAGLAALAAYALWWHKDAWTRFETLQGMRLIEYQRSDSESGDAEIWSFVTDRPAQEVAESLIKEARREGAPESNLVVTKQDELGRILNLTFKSRSKYWTIMVSDGKTPGLGRATGVEYPKGATIMIMYSDVSPVNDGTGGTQ